MKTVSYNSESVDESLERLHKIFLKHNEHDEGDLIFYRIDYRLAEILKVTADEARAYHQIYHTKNPRTVSKAYCSNCNQIVTFVPIIYTVTENERSLLKAAEMKGRVILGDLENIMEDHKIPMFGCAECKKPIPSVEFFELFLYLTYCLFQHIFMTGTNVILYYLV